MGACADHFAANPRPQFFGRAIGDDFPAVDDCHPVAAFRFFHQVGGEENGHALLISQPIKRFPEIDPRTGIESGGGFVEEQNLRPMEQALGDFDPALQTAGERFDEVARTIVEVELEQKTIDPLT